MDHQPKSVKLMSEGDRLTELPDGILSAIISMLPLKEGVRTSILSKSWRSIWINHSDLLFDSINVLGIGVHSVIKSNCERHNFVEMVDHLMHQRCEGKKISSLAIHFHLGQNFASQMNHWISCAVSKGVENIDIDLSEECSFKMDYSFPDAFERYAFPSWLLAAPGKKCTVKHLRLSSCSFSSLPSSNSLSSLVSVKMNDISINDHQLENFLSVCSVLERLSLHLCKGLVKLKFAGPSSRLKHLSIEYCFRLEKVEINAKNLSLLEYIGHLVNFSFKNAPRLAEVFLSFTGSTRLDGVTYALTRFAHDLPQLKTLNLLSLLSVQMLKLPAEQTVPMFNNLKQLLLTVFPFHDDDKLEWISYTLRAFPLLQKLQLNLFSPNFIKPSKKMERQLPECPHGHLKELEINGFYGNQHEVELLNYLIENVTGLEVLVINPCQKLYKGFSNWEYEAVSSWYKLRMESVEWLHAVVPPTVRLMIG